jgi:hypothetical protein
VCHLHIFEIGFEEFEFEASEHNADSKVKFGPSQAAPVLAKPLQIAIVYVKQEYSLNSQTASWTPTKANVKLF